MIEKKEMSSGYLASLERKHGQHDQSTHGRRGGRSVGSQVMSERKKEPPSTTMKNLNDEMKKIGFSISSRETTGGAIKTWLEREEGFDLGKDVFPLVKKKYPDAKFENGRVGKYRRDPDEIRHDAFFMSNQGKNGLFIEVYRKNRYGRMESEGMDSTDIWLTER